MSTSVRIARVNDWAAGVDNLDYRGFAAKIAANVLMLRDRNLLSVKAAPCAIARPAVPKSLFDNSALKHHGCFPFIFSET